MIFLFVMLVMRLMMRMVILIIIRTSVISIKLSSFPREEMSYLHYVFLFHSSTYSLVSYIKTGVVLSH